MLPADQDGEGMRSTIELRTPRQSLLLHLLAQNYVWLSGPWQGGLSKRKMITYTLAETKTTGLSGCAPDHWHDMEIVPEAMSQSILPALARTSVESKI